MQARTQEKGHGRLETREIWALSVWPEQVGFYGAEQVVRIRRQFLYLKSGRQSEETVLAITGLQPLADVQANGLALLEIARAHWAIENGNHYVRDRTYDEDRCQVREPNSAQILSTLRSLARFLAKPPPPDAREPSQNGLSRPLRADNSPITLRIFVFSPLPSRFPPPSAFLDAALDARANLPDPGLTGV